MYKIEEVKYTTGPVVVKCQMSITKETATNGNPYLKVELSDRSKLVINIFSDNPIYPTLSQMEFDKLLFTEVTLEYKGVNGGGYAEYTLSDVKQLVQPSLIDCVDIPKLIDELRTIITNIQDNNLKTLLFEMCAYKNKELLNKLFECPVTEKSAYSFKGGTLAHIVRTCRLCEAISSVYNTWNFNLNGFNETLNVDLLKTIAIFHDLGKAEKYYFENDQIKRTFKGELLTDSIISVDLFKEILSNTKANLLEEQKTILEHAIGSAKGSIENGSVCTPRTKEAEIFAAIERIEVTMGNFEYLQRTNIGDEFQKLFNKQYYVEDFVNSNLKKFL